MILKAVRHFFWLAGAFYTLASTFLLSLFLSISNIHTCSFHQFTWIGCFASFPWHHLNFLLESHVLLQNLPRILMPFFTLESAEPLFKSVKLMSKTFWDFVQATSSVHTSLPSLIALVILLFLKTRQASNGQGPPILLLQPLPLLSNLVSIDFHILQHNCSQQYSEVGLTSNIFVRFCFFGSPHEHLSSFALHDFIQFF